MRVFLSLACLAALAVTLGGCGGRDGDLRRHFKPGRNWAEAAMAVEGLVGKRDSFSFSCTTEADERFSFGRWHGRYAVSATIGGDRLVPEHDKKAFDAAVAAEIGKWDCHKASFHIDPGTFVRLELGGGVIALARVEKRSAAGAVTVVSEDALGGAQARRESSQPMLEAEPAWEFTASGARPRFRAPDPPAIAPDGTIYMGSMDGLHALAPDGSLKWTYPAVGLVSSSPAVAEDGTIVAVGLEGTLVLLGPDGAARGQLAVGKSPAGSPVVEGSRAYVVSGRTLWAVDLAALAAQETAVVWSYQGFGKEVGLSMEAATGAPTATPWGSIYAGCAAFLCEISDGDQRSTATVKGGLRLAPAVGADGTLYVVSGPRLLAIARNQEERWRFTAADEIQGAPTLGPDGTVYVTAGTKLYAVAPPGVEKWSVSMGRRLRSAVTVAADGTLYAGAEGMLCAVRPDGRPKWGFATGTVTGAPAIGADGTLYVATLDGKLRAVRDPEGNGGLAAGEWPKLGRDGRNSGLAPYLARTP